MKLPQNTSPISRHQTSDKRMTGLGDAVQMVTKKLGFKPCQGCDRRAAALNRMWSFGHGGQRH